ncbi:MAG: 30S ribosomal protein S3 [Candidatus Heimdallarchaeota archaeon]
MPNSIKSFTERRLNQAFLDELFAKELASAEYGHMIYSPSSSSTKIILKVGRVGLAIGRRGKTIKTLSEKIKKITGEKNIQIEVEALEEPEALAQVMATRLASSLERGRHFRRSAYGTIRRIMSAGALGCQITVSGKITSQRARVENFREGFVAKTGHPAEMFVDRGYAKAKIKRGILGVCVWIMQKDAVLPDAVEIIAEPTHTSREITDTDLDEEFTDLDEQENLEPEEFGDLDISLDDLSELESVESEVDSTIPNEATQALTEELVEAEAVPEELVEAEAVPEDEKKESK